MKLRRTKKGFTIVELVIVVGVIGILSAILIPTFVNLTSQAKANALQLTLRDVYTEYVAEASDGVVDGTEYSIDWLSQKEVQLTDTAANGKTYHWNEETSKWEVGQVSGEGTLVYVAYKMEGNPEARVGYAAQSTFGGYKVEYKVAA